MKELLTVTLAVILLTLNLVPFFIVLSLLFPARLAKTQANVDRMPGRTFVIGMVNFLFLLLIALVFFSLGDKVGGPLKAVLMLPALVIIAALFVAVSFGLGGVANSLGERLAPDQSKWRQVLWGTLLLGLGCSVPIVGWFLLFPYAGWVGTGAFIISFFQKS